MKKKRSLFETSSPNPSGDFLNARFASTLASGLARFLGSEAVSGTSGVRGFPAFASSLARFLRRELVRRPLLMRRPSAFAGDLSLQRCAHAGKSSVLGHGSQSSAVKAVDVPKPETIRP